MRNEEIMFPKFRYPNKSHRDFELPTDVSYFCQPGIVYWNKYFLFNLFPFSFSFFHYYRGLSNDWTKRAPTATTFASSTTRSEFVCVYVDRKGFRPGILLIIIPFNCANLLFKITFPAKPALCSSVCNDENL